MKAMILNRYLMFEFSKPFIFSTLVFALVISIGHLFDRMEVFIRNSVGAGTVILYLSAMLPLWLIQALPLCTLIAGVLAVGNLCESGEMTCLRSSGMSSKRILLPFFAVGVVLTGLTFLAGDSFMPWATHFARSLYRREVDKMGVQKPVWDNVIAIAKDRRRVSAKRLDIEKSFMEIVSVETYGDRFNLRQELTAQRADWNPRSGWTFYDGVVRLFSVRGDEIVEEEAFTMAHIQLSESPGDLVPLQILPEELSVQELKGYIRKINDLGVPALTERVQYHLKFAFPFTHLLVLAIGIPIAFRTTAAGGGRGKKSFGRMKSLAVALAVALSYFGLIAVGQALGESRKLEPWMGVWMANAVFLAAGIFMIRKVE